MHQFCILSLLLVTITFIVRTYCEPIIGIDLGTTYSCVAILRNNRVEVLPNELGNRITPSVVSFSTEGTLVGEPAQHQLTRDPYHTVYDVKRLIGRKYSEAEVRKDVNAMTYDVINRGGQPAIRIAHDQIYSPEEISSLILLKMKSVAEMYLGQSVTKAVVTVPAYFNDAQRQATKSAAAMAGLSVERIINEPTAAAIAYGFDQNKTNTNVLVVDIGGGTYDVSLLNMDDGMFEVLATFGDSHFGGEDFDNRVLQFTMNEFQRIHQRDMSTDHRSVQRLRLEVEKAKRVLSNQMEATIHIDSLYQGLDFTYKLTRAKFEQLNRDLFSKVLQPIQQVLRDSKVRVQQVDEIILVGGSSRIPRIQQIIADYFGKKPRSEINPDEAVASGAAIQAGILAGEVDSVTVSDVTSLSLGVASAGGVMTPIIRRNTRIPTSATKTFSTHEDFQSAVLVKIYQGERALVRENMHLASFELGDIPRAPRGKPRIEVKFAIDANGILEVIARDKRTGNINSITVKSDIV